MADSQTTSDDEQLAGSMARHNAAVCKNCGRLLDRGDVSWNNGCTEAGTPMTWAQIVCQACGTEAAHWRSWYPGADDLSEFVEHVLPDWE